MAREARRLALGHRLKDFFSLRLCGSAALREKFQSTQNAEKPPAFAGGFGLGAIPELREMYGTTVTVSRKLGRIIQETEK